MDMLTQGRKRVKYARVLIEMDDTKPRVSELDIELHIGDVTVKLEYEQDFKILSYGRSCKGILF